MILTQDDRGFLDAHKVYFEQAKMKFLHGFSPWVMDRFNAIFVKYVQPGYVLTPWCSECVIDMVTKLGAWYDGIRDEEMLSLQAGAANVAAQFVFPDDLDTITVQRGDTVMDAPIKKKAGRPKKSKMRILAVTQPMSGVGYHRVMLPLSKMPGVYVLFTDFINDEVLQRGFDIVMFNRYIPGVELQTLLDFRTKYGFKIVVDIDDYWKLDPWHILANGFPSAVVVDHIAAADLVTVTHERLRRAVLMHNPNCEILPNALPYGEDQFTMQKVAGIHKDGIFEDTKRLRVLYAGGITHERDVALLQNPMRRMASDTWLRDRLFMIMAGYDDSNPRVTPIWHRMISDYLCGFRMEGYVRAPLPPDQYMAFYAEADIAVAPLVESLFNSCKSNIKVLEAGCKNIPIIVSNVPPYDDCPYAIKVNHQRDWYESFKRLVKYDWYRKEIGEENGAWCRENHDLKKWNVTRKELYQTLIK